MSAPDRRHVGEEHGVDERTCERCRRPPLGVSFSVDFGGTEPAPGDHVAVPADLYADLNYLAGWAHGAGAPEEVVQRIHRRTRQPLSVVRFDSGDTRRGGAP